jgi:hypothetical protein
MKTFRMKLDMEYEVEAESIEEAYVELEERFAIENITAVNEFWDNIEVTEIQEKENENERI